jgi:hypothetical protein
MAIEPLEIAYNPVGAVGIDEGAIDEFRVRERKPGSGNSLAGVLKELFGIILKESLDVCIHNI